MGLCQQIYRSLKLSIRHPWLTFEKNKTWLMDVKTGMVENVPINNH